MSLYTKNKRTNIIDETQNKNNISKEYQQDINILKNDINQFQIKEIIGEGMFGKVKLAIHLLTNEKIAIKIFDKGKIKSKKEKEYIEREISILKKLNHYNTIKLFNIIQNNDFIYLIQEYINGKELLHFIENNENLSEKDICKLYRQIIAGIEYMHEIGIAHRDLKLENILLNYKKDIKIIDFGLSNKYDRDIDELLHSSCGSPCYAAPEMIKGIEYHGINTDIWSSGIILYIMLCKKFPFNDKNNSKLYQKILSGKFIIPNNLSNEAKDLIINLLKVNPEERIKLDEIKNHPWFNLVNKDNNYFKGININKTIIPIDEDIIKEMKKFGVDRNIIINDLLKNNFNNITTTYHLLLQKKVRNGKKSVADFCSDLYLNYINDEKNKISFFNNDFELILKDRINHFKNIENNIRTIPSINIEYGFSKTFGYHNLKNNYNNYNYLFGKTIQKINSKSDEYTYRQITDRQKDKNITLNFPIKFHTIDHDSYSNSKNKKIINKKLKNKSPDITQFNTKKNNNNFQYNINTIKNNGYSLKKYLEILPITHHYIEPKKSNDLYIRLLNRQSMNKKPNNIFNYLPKNKQYLFNKSVDNRRSKEKNNGINNYINFNNNKFNKFNQIRKKLGEPLEIKKNQKTIENHSSTPIKTEVEKNNYTKTIKENSFINVYNNFNLDYKNDKAIAQLSKNKISKDRKNKSNNKSLNISNNCYVHTKNNKNKKNIIMGLSFNNNINYTKEISNFGVVNKRNNFFFEEKENNNKALLSLSQQKDKKKIKTKKASSLSIDLNLRNQGKNDFNIYNNKQPKRKNVMKFINKNNNNDINGNYKLNNIYNKYTCYYKNEIKKNIHNKSLESNIKKLDIY